MLLHWCTLQPSGPSNLAAVRFSSPIRLYSIRIFPAGVRPFTQCPEVVASTKPDAFFLDVFFNAQASQTEPKDKSRPPNALVPTVIAYAGGQMDFTVDMGPEHSTRLMIIKGSFESVSMAIYGDSISEIKPLVQSYQPQQITSVDARPLTHAVDPSNSADPTLLAQQILALVPDAPPLPLVIRLMLCLKPSNDDWDDPEFPYLFAELVGCTEDFDLDRALDTTSRPVADDTPPDVLQRFSESFAAAISDKSIAQSSLVAEILCQVAPQRPDFARILMEHLDLENVFDAYNMDYSTITRLLDAAANIDIARHLRADWFVAALRTVQELSAADKELQLAVRRLFTRIQGWQILEDALSDTRADFNAAADMMKDFGKEEKSLGIWLGTMTMHNEILIKLAENPVLPNPQCPPSLFGAHIAISHDDFIAFVRAYIGVCSVLAVYAWSDSLPNARCRELALGIIRLWQSVDGYREIVNHLLQLRQMVFRLESLTEDHNPPSPSLIHVEHILVDLVNSPTAIIRPDLFKCVLSLRQPLSCITADELHTMRRLAFVAEQGLPAALEEIAIFVTLPVNIEGLRVLRVALAIMEGEYKEAEFRVLQGFWDDGKHTIISHLVDIFVVVRDALKEMFPRSPASSLSRRFLEELFHTAADVLRNINILLLAYPPTGRPTRILSVAIADVFACVDAVDMSWSHSSSLFIAAAQTRQICIDSLRSLSTVHVSLKPGKPIAEIVLQTLLEHAVKLNERDPIRHVSQVYCLVDHLLPLPTADMEQKSYWTFSIIPSMLPEIRSFFRLLDTQNRTQFIKRLVKIDGGVVEIGEWILLEELRDLFCILQSWNDDMGERRQVFGEYEITLSLRFLSELASSSGLPSWLITSIENHAEIGQVLAEILACFLDNHISSPALSHLTEVLASKCSVFDSHLRFMLAVTLLHSAPDLDSLISIIDLVSMSLRIFRDLQVEFIDMNRLTLGIGQTLSAISSSENIDGLDAETSEVVVDLLDCVTKLCPPDSITLMISDSSFAKLCVCMEGVLPLERIEFLNNVRSKVMFDWTDSTVSSNMHLAECIQLSIEDLENILCPPISMPSTPKRNTPDLLSLVTISPPTAVLRSPAATGLTKTYSNNDFRQLRQLPSTRQNTSRLPSMHVDDFESSPVLVPASMPEVFLGLSPPFNTI